MEDDVPQPEPYAVLSIVAPTCTIYDMSPTIADDCLHTYMYMYYV
jgi:hypothetical protein